MRLGIFILLFFLCALPDSAAWENTLAPTGDGVSVELVRDKCPLYRITGTPQIACDMLREGLRCATGVDFPSGGNDAPKTIELAPDASSGDAFAIAIDDAGNLRLSGNTLNAAAALLAEDLGVRAYAVETGLEFPAGVPITTAHIVPRSEDTPFAMRYPYFQELRGEARNPFYRWGRFNRVAEGIKAPDTLGWTHDFTTLVPNELLKTQPEFFSLVQGTRLPGGNDSSSGQLCLTNPALVEYLVKRCRELLAANPRARYLTVSQNDCGRWCECPECAAVFQREGSQAGALLLAVNQIAEALNPDYPGLTVVTDAYIESRPLPRHVRPAENTAIEMCLSDRIKWTQYVPLAETEEGNYLRQWCATGNPVFIWDYCVDFSDYLPPTPDYPVLDQNIDFFRANGVKGVMMLGNYSASDTAQKRMRAWVLAQKYWNPDFLMDDLIRDFNFGYFGAGAGKYMQQYSELLDREWTGWHATRDGDRFRFSADFLPQAEALFTAALAAAENDEYRARVERESIAVGYLRLLTGSTGATDGLTAGQRTDRWAALCERYGINNGQEGSSDVAGLLPRLRNKDREQALATTVPAGTLHLLPATRAFIEHDAELREDPAAALGMAASSDGANPQWGIHWHLDDFPEIALGQTYRVFALVRADSPKVAGPAIHTTWWNALTDARPGTVRDLDASELSETEYRWIDCGTVKPEKNGVYLLFAPFGNGTVERIYVQAVALVRY